MSEMAYRKNVIRKRESEMRTCTFQAFLIDEKLSKYEDPIAEVIFDDLSNEALELYRTKANIAPEVKSNDFQGLLRHLGLLGGEANAPTSTGFEVTP